MKSINDDIMKFIRERQSEGERKYGKTIERDDLKPSAWANHALEEMADGIQYAVRCVEAVERLEHAANLAVHELTYQFSKLPDCEEKDRMVATVRRLVIALDGGEKKAVGLPWHEAPEWAMWAAMDRDGAWWWFDAEPSLCGDSWGAVTMKWRRFRHAPHANPRTSKQRRPE